MFSERGFGGWNTQNGSSFIFAYTDFTNIGDAANPGWQVGYDNAANNSVQWNVTYSTFTHCGKISSSSGIGSLMGPGGGAVFQHSYNIHQNTASNEIFDGWFGTTAANHRHAHGAKQFVRCAVFHVGVSDVRVHVLVELLRRRGGDG